MKALIRQRRFHQTISSWNENSDLTYETEAKIYLHLRKIAPQLKVLNLRLSHLLLTLCKVVGCSILRANQQQSRQHLLCKHLQLNFSHEEQQIEARAKSKTPKGPLAHLTEALTCCQELPESSRRCFTSNRGTFWQAIETLLTTNLELTSKTKACVSLEHQKNQIYK